MSTLANVVVAIDDSDASERALQYAAAFLCDRAEVDVYPLHVLGPLPEELLVAGEKRLTDELRDTRAAWMAEARADARPLLEKARRILEKSGIAADRVKPRMTEAAAPNDLAEAIVEGARSLGCGTIVVGRDSIAWVPQLFSHHVAERVAREAGRLAVWIVG